MTRAQTNRFFILLSAPFIGIFVLIFLIDVSIEIRDVQSPSIKYEIDSIMKKSNEQIIQASADTSDVQGMVESMYETYDLSVQETVSMLKLADVAKKQPLLIYDKRVTVKLGEPIEAINSKNLDAKLFAINESTYTGYALKIKVKTEDAAKMILGKDQLGESETTLSASNRYNATIATSFGGFADDQKTKKRYPLSTTMVDGKYVQGFFPTFKDLAFVGFNKSMKLIGGKFDKQADLDSLEPQFGASFVPVLLEKGKTAEIPKKWQTSPARAARVAIASYKNDDVLIVVTNASNEKGNSGATLKELQSKLLSLGTIDAYNMDGGGSATLVFDGKVINKPSDGILRPLSTHLLFFK